MDVEGAEPLVWAGGASVFTAADLLVMEFSPMRMKPLAHLVEPLLQRLSRSFRNATVSLGDSSAEDSWISAAEAVDILRAHWRDPHIKGRYFETKFAK
jgi:hypothetical protein